MFAFPGEPRWNDAEDAVEFAVELGEYRGLVFISRRVFQTLLGRRPAASECIECFHLERTRFERLAEAKLRARELSDDANLRLSPRDVRRLGKP